jgi:hypothetical protein
MIQSRMAWGIQGGSNYIVRRLQALLLVTPEMGVRQLDNYNNNNNNNNDTNNNNNNNNKNNNNNNNNCLTLMPNNRNWSI